MLKSFLTRGLGSTVGLCDVVDGECDSPTRGDRAGNGGGSGSALASRVMRGERVDLKVSGCYAPSTHPHVTCGKAGTSVWRPGTLEITNYRITFTPSDVVADDVASPAAAHSPPVEPHPLFDVAIAKLLNVVKIGYSTAGRLADMSGRSSSDLSPFTYKLQLTFSGCCRVELAFPPEDGSRMRVYEHLMGVVNVLTSCQGLERFFCFQQGASPHAASAAVAAAAASATTRHLRTASNGSPCASPSPCSLSRGEHCSRLAEHLVASAAQGWSLCSPELEFGRQGALNNGWRLSQVNSGYAVADSYPEVLCVPECVTDEELQVCAEFRALGRFPVLSYYYADTGASLTRSAQPGSGMLSSLCEADVTLVRKIATASHVPARRQHRPAAPAAGQRAGGGVCASSTLCPTNTKAVRRSSSSSTTCSSCSASDGLTPRGAASDAPHASTPSPSDARGRVSVGRGASGGGDVAPARRSSSASGGGVAAASSSESLGGTFEIIDLRPRCNAQAQKLQGGGFEDSSVYGARVSFAGIENIHHVRDSHKKMEALVLASHAHTAHTPNARWLSQMEDARWLEFVGLLLSTSQRCVDLMRRGVSLLLHCSHGWDRTAQVVSLVQVILDPFYRTVEGFAMMIEREWVQGGHNFRSRCGFGQATETSPIFLQFLDAVHQLQLQNPTAFEFNGSLLVHLADCLYSCRHGTFLANSPRELTDFSMSTRTPSVWTDVLAKGTIKRYLNDACLTAREHAALRPHDPPSATAANGTAEKPSENPTGQHASAQAPLEVDSRPQSLVFWKAHFLRYAGGAAVPRPVPKSRIEAVAVDLAAQVRALERDVQCLKGAVGSSGGGGGGGGGSTSAIQCYVQQAKKDKAERRTLEKEVRALREALFKATKGGVSESVQAPVSGQPDDAASFGSDRETWSEGAGGPCTVPEEDPAEGDFENFDSFWMVDQGADGEAFVDHA